MRLFVETIWLAELHILRETTFNKFPVVAYLFLEIPGKHQFGISKETAVFVKYRSTGKNSFNFVERLLLILCNIFFIVSIQLSRH